MADRYWVGGTANWDGTAGTKWATTSGGAGGASVPTSADDVFFDAASGVSTVTLVSVATCRSLNCTGFTGTLTGSATLQVFGDFILDAGMTYGSSIDNQLRASTGSWIINTNGKTLNSLSVGVVVSTATWSLDGALTLSNTLTVTYGTFNSSNYNITAASINSNNSNVRSINLGSSSITLSFSFQATTTTNLTLNAGTSTINFTPQNANLFFGTSGSPGTATLYNISFSSTTAGTHNLRGLLTLNNLSVAAPSTAGVTILQIEGRQTINGTLSTTGTAGNRRVWFRSQTYGLAQTLTVNATPSLTDADFRDIYVIGTAAPISGTRVGDLRGIRGITRSTPKSVYWVTAAGGNWSANNWAASSGGAASTDNFPLAQDTAVIENTGLNTSATVTLDNTITYFGTIDMSTRTNAMTLAGSTAYTVYGDWKFGSGVTRSYTGGLTFSGRNTQTITSAGKAFAQAFTIDTYGGTVELADALNIGSNALTVTNGTFDTKNYNVTSDSISSSNSNIRTITLGSSTVTLGGSPAVSASTTINLTFNAGTSQINITRLSAQLTASNLTFYNVSFTTTSASTHTLRGVMTFNSLSITAPSSAGLTQLSVENNQTITGTLTVAGATPIRRIFIRSDTINTTRTLTVGTLSATDCDFRDITIAGTAAGSSPTRAGDCGGNSGITFSAPKTVYWNLAGTQNWSATAWAPGSGGVPDINNFPLAQDTAVFDNTGAVGTVTINAVWNTGTFDASARTSAMTLDTNTNVVGLIVYGSWKSGTGLSIVSSSATTNFFTIGSQTLTSNGVQFTFNLGFNGRATGIMELSDALSLSSDKTISLSGGTFDAKTYNVTSGVIQSGGSSPRTIKMGTGTWTCSGVGSVWSITDLTNASWYKQTANIVLSDTSATARTFTGAGLSYNKLTIGGATGISTTTITGDNQFTELASTKTVAHTIALGSTTQTFGAWTVTGTSGNVVTLTGTGTSHILAGACTSGIDYLAMGSIGFSASSPAEFYAGANSTGTAAAPVYRTAKPADSTRYWVGGTGNWSSTTKWSTSSGGASGASVPRSHDDVVFNSASNATAYTATVDAVTGGIRVKALTIAGPASGNVTLAGSTAIVGIHGNVTLPATGLTRTYTGAITLTGSTSGKTLTTNGVALSSILTVDGIGCEWTLGSALNIGTSNDFNIYNGSFITGNYALTANLINAIKANGWTTDRSINLGSSTITTGSAPTFPIMFGTTTVEADTLTFNCGTSTILIPAFNGTFNGNGKTFYNVSLNYNGNASLTISGANTFNDLSITGITGTGIKTTSFANNQIINGTLTISAGTDATMRNFVRSDTFGTTRTLTCAAVSMTDVDFRDITIAGVAAPATGTRIGDCKGNSGITFTAAANKYWNLAGNNNWTATAWATSSGGSPSINNFPLAQDTCIFQSTSPGTGATTTISIAYNIGTIDMSARTTNTMTLATGSSSPFIYGNWINGTGTTLTGTGTLTFAGRGSQTVTSAGKTFTQNLTIDTPTGTVTLQDALICNQQMTVTRGGIDGNNYNVTFTGTGSSTGVLSSNTNTRTISIGSGTWTIASTSGWSVSIATNFTVTGTGTISLTSTSSNTFTGGSVAYTNITLNQGGAGTLTISGNNTFKDITNTYKATGATAISLGTTTQRVSQWTAAGEAGRVLTVQGTSASSPGTLILTGATKPNVDYLTVTGVRAYDLTDTWYAGTNSINNGSLGWNFNVEPAPSGSTSGFFLMFMPM